jgi:UDP-N-acetylglucosamine 4-epimerase
VAFVNDARAGAEAEVAPLEVVRERLVSRPLRWLVTGCAGFIGSHLVEALLRLEQAVVGLDNFSTGFRRNLEQVQDAVPDLAWRCFHFVEGDIRDPGACRDVCKGVDIVLHQAALGSVPRSIQDPLRTHDVNSTGFLNLLIATRDAGVARLVYAASSSTYGDSPDLPKVEHKIGAPLSPYAVTKLTNELYASVFSRCYGTEAIGLRYFNVFGSRQDPNGQYAAVIPRFVATMLRSEPVTIYGDGETSRDFCYVANVVQANLLAATVRSPDAIGQVYNVAVGDRLSLNELHRILGALIAKRHPSLPILPPVYADPRSGDVRHSQADVDKARRLLGYRPHWDVSSGLADALSWYERHADVFEPQQSRGEVKQPL